MNWVDIVILLVVGASFVSGFTLGFVRIGIGFAALVLAFFAASWFYGLPAAWFAPYVASKAIASILGFLLIFAGVMVSGSILAAFLSRLLKVVGLSWADRMMGAAFGLLRGTVVVAAGLMIITAFVPSPPRAIAESSAAPYALSGARILARVAPFQIRQGFRRSYWQLESFWRSAVGRRFDSKRRED